MAKTPNMLPKQPHLRLPVGNGSEIKATIRPTNGVKITEMRKVQPKPIFRRAPTRPTSTDSSEPEIRPNMRSGNVMTCNIYLFPFISSTNGLR